MTQTDRMVLHKSIVVACPVETAFRIFSDGIADWWPLATHSIGDEHAVTCALEGRVGGRIFETLDDGRECEWGIVSAWEPPSTVAFSWYPGRDPATAQQVTVRFAPADGGTVVDLEHTGWENLGSEAENTFRGYDQGWDIAFGQCFARAANAG